MKVGVLNNIFSPRCFPMSCLLPNGSINEERVKYYCELFAAMAGHMHGEESHVYIRLFPFFLLDRDMFPTENLLDHVNHIPWKFKDGKFNFDLVNELFYENVEKLFKIANESGLRIKWTILDRCHMNNRGGKNRKGVPESPFFLNHQGITSMYDNKAMRYIQFYLRKVLEIAKNYVVDYELINEPRASNQTIVPICKMMLKELKNYNIPMRNIESGKELYHLNNQNELINNDYTKWMWPLDFDDDIKRNGGLASLHGISTKVLYAKPAPELRTNTKDDEWINNLTSHYRRVAWKTDGAWQTKKWWKEEFLKFLQQKPLKKRKTLFEMDFEATYFGEGPGYKTDIYELQGIVECMYEYTGKWVCGSKPKELNLKDPGMNPPKKEIIIIEPKKKEKEKKEEKKNKTIQFMLSKWFWILIGIILIILLIL